MTCLAKRRRHRLTGYRIATIFANTQMCSAAHCCDKRYNSPRRELIGEGKSAVIVLGQCQTFQIPPRWEDDVQFLSVRLGQRIVGINPEEVAILTI